MRIYLDNNIFIAIENHQIDENDLINNFGPNIQLVYSFTHIQELLEVNNNFDELKNKRFETINKLTRNTLIQRDSSIDGKFITKIENPEFYLKTAQKFDYISIDNKQYARELDKIDRKKLIEILSINTLRINNYSEREIIDLLNKSLMDSFDLTLIELLNLFGKLLCDQINSIFHLLDFIGFYKDEVKNKANMSRTYDAYHAYYASGCDLYLSNDRNARQKTKIAYALKDIKTEVMEWKIK